MNAMNDQINMDKDIPTNAVSLYGEQDAMDDFPVLKAFQQYIDSEQAKARKRMVMLSMFFGVLMAVVVAFFIVLLMNVSNRNQALNDRMLEYVMKERERPSGSAVVVQPSHDTSAILSLTTKLDEMQKKLAESQAAAQKAASEAAAARAAAKPHEPSAEEVEIARLKALLEAEKKNKAAEKARKRQAEIEAYRRKHYPEFYRDELDDLDDDEDLEEELPVIRRPKSNKGAPVKTVPEPEIKKSEKKAPEIKPTEAKTTDAKRAQVDAKPAVDVNAVNALLQEVDAIKYFEESDDKSEKTESKPQKNNSIPVEIKGSSSSWNIPLE